MSEKMSPAVLYEIYNAHDGICQRCCKKASEFAFVIDHKNRLVCTHCDAGIRLFMDNNFAKKTAPSTRPSRRGRSIKYPLDEVLETREHYMAVRDFVMSHPEIEYGEILRSNSKLVKELKNVVFGQTV